jgi:MFS family permease
MVPVLPFALTVRAGVDEKDLQKWTSVFLSVYGAALAVGSLAFGWVADRSTSRRIPLLVGLVALAGATAMLCVGNGLGVLIAGRFLQGLSAAVVWTVGLALLSDTVPKEEIGQVMGYAAAAQSIGSLAGPLLGGVVYAKAGYYAVFAMGFALIGLDIILRLIMVEKSLAEQWAASNEASPSNISSNTGNLGPQEQSGAGEIQVVPMPDESSPSETPAQSEKTAVAATHNWLERLPPMITLLRLPRLLAALFGCYVISTSLAAFDSVLPLFVKQTFHWNSLGAGLIFICLVIPSICSPIIGMISDRCGSRTLTTTGLLGSVPFWVLLRLVTHDSIGQKVLLGALLVVIGFFMTLVMAPLMRDLDHTLTVEEKRKPGSLGTKGAAAQAFGLFNMAYAAGSVIGPLWAGFVAEKAGWVTMGWTLGLLSGVGGIVTFIWTGGRIMLKGREREGAGAVV